MARPERNSVDYFPFICEEGKKMYYIEETYGNDGFATFVKILRELAKTEYHYLNLSKQTTLMFLCAKCKVSKETLISIINDLVELDKFNATLWNENKIIWCQDFIDSIQDAYFKRKNKCMTFEGLLLLLQSLGVRKQSKLQSIVPDNTQSIIYNTIEKNKILNNSLLSEIKISDDKKFFLIKDLQIEAEQNEIEYFKIAEKFQKLFIKNLKEKKSPTANQEKANFKNYVNPIRLLLENKEATKEQLREAYSFLNSIEGEFWKSNILSTATLRKQIATLIAKKNIVKVLPLQNQNVPDHKKRNQL